MAASLLLKGGFMFYNIAVVGFGLAGRLAALELSKSHHVTVFEASDEHTQNSAGKVAAAMLAPLAESVLCETDLAIMGLNSLKRWPEIVSELEGEGKTVIQRQTAPVRHFLCHKPCVIHFI